jgi:hypothetical protein
MRRALFNAVMKDRACPSAGSSTPGAKVDGSREVSTPRDRQFTRFA